MGKVGGGVTQEADHTRNVSKEIKWQRPGGQLCAMARFQVSSGLHIRTYVGGDTLYIQTEQLLPVLLLHC